MLEEIPPKRGSFAPLLIAMAVCFCGVILSLGLCGLDSHLHPGSGLSSGSALAGAGMILFLLSFVAGVICVLALIVQVIINAFRK